MLWSIISACLIFPLFFFFASARTKGLNYVISFGIGALLVTVVLWILRYAYNLYQCKGNYIEAYSVLPSMHLKEMWLVGAICGSLWQMANIGSIVSVQFLGEGVGYSVVQAALLVSGKCK
jgi:glucose uptake protein GlcU